MSNSKKRSSTQPISVKITDYFTKGFLSKPIQPRTDENAIDTAHPQPLKPKLRGLDSSYRQPLSEIGHKSNIPLRTPATRRVVPKSNFQVWRDEPPAKSPPEKTSPAPYSLSAATPSERPHLSRQQSSLSVESVESTDSKVSTEPGYKRTKPPTPKNNPSKECQGLLPQQTHRSSQNNTIMSQHSISSGIASPTERQRKTSHSPLFFSEPTPPLSTHVHSPTEPSTHSDTPPPLQDAPSDAQSPLSIPMFFVLSTSRVTVLCKTSDPTSLLEDAELSSSSLPPLPPPEESDCEKEEVFLVFKKDTQQSIKTAESVKPAKHIHSLPTQVKTLL
ncbi:hypothetical protein BDF14DRAFT_884487 [Spinellus fusiger]|nr:hypothetical protein BDF14DRAFT_884487 [Spinellus fusiger]